MAVGILEIEGRGSAIGQPDPLLLESFLSPDEIVAGEDQHVPGSAGRPFSPQCLLQHQNRGPDAEPDRAPLILAFDPSDLREAKHVGIKARGGVAVADPKGEVVDAFHALL